MLIYGTRKNYFGQNLLGDFGGWRCVINIINDELYKQNTYIYKIWTLSSTYKIGIVIV